MNSLSILNSAEKATSLSNMSVSPEIVEQEKMAVPQMNEKSEVCFNVSFQPSYLGHQSPCRRWCAAVVHFTGICPQLTDSARTGNLRDSSPHILSRSNSLVGHPERLEVHCNPRDGLWHLQCSLWTSSDDELIPPSSSDSLPASIGASLDLAECSDIRFGKSASYQLGP